MKTFTIGISGGSGSGKSSLAKLLQEALPEYHVKVIGADKYFFRPLPTMISPMTGEEMDEYNSPESIDYQALQQEIIHTLWNKDTEILIVEGNGIFYFEDLREIMDLKIFVDLEIEQRMYRRIVRNMAAGRGSMEEIADFYLKSARFSEQKYFIPTKRFADLIVSGENYQGIAKDVILNYIRNNCQKNED